MMQQGAELHSESQRPARYAQSLSEVNPLCTVTSKVSNQNGAAFQTGALNSVEGRAFGEPTQIWREDRANRSLTSLASALHRRAVAGVSPAPFTAQTSGRQCARARAHTGLPQRADSCDGRYPSKFALSGSTPIDRRRRKYHSKSPQRRIQFSSPRPAASPRQPSRMRRQRDSSSSLLQLVTWMLLYSKSRRTRSRTLRPPVFPRSRSRSRKRASLFANKDISCKIYKHTIQVSMLGEGGVLGRLLMTYSGQTGTQGKTNHKQARVYTSLMKNYRHTVLRKEHGTRLKTDKIPVERLQAEDNIRPHIRLVL